jgi:hypothetical protein
MLCRCRRNNDRRRKGRSAWRECGGLFLDSLAYYLAEAPPSIRSYGPVASAFDGLTETLARNLNKLDLVSSLSTGAGEGGDNDDDMGITAVKSWLWGGEGLMWCAAALPLEEGRSKTNKIVQKWDALLTRLLASSFSNDGEQQHSGNTPKNQTPACKQLFYKILESL